MDNEERGDGLDHDPAEPAAVDPADQVASAESADVVEEPVAFVEEPAPIAEETVPVVEPEPTEPVAVFEPEPEPEPEAVETYDSYEAAPYADEPTVAHEVFAPPTPAAATFAAPVAVEEIEVEADDDEEDEERKGISFATKAIIVGAAWVLLVLFLIGQFEGDDDAGVGPVGLDQTEESGDGTELAAGEEGGEEPVDLDGDGEIEPGEPGFGASGSVEGASAGDGTSGGSGSGGTSGSSGSTSGGGTGDGTSDDAAPVTLPGGAPAPTSTTTTVKGGSTSTTATTTKPGGGSTSTTAPPTTTTQPGTPPPVTINVDRDGSANEFSKTSQSLEVGGSIRFVNKDSIPHTLDIGGTTRVLPGSGEVSFQFTQAGTFTVTCSVPGHKSNLTVTVS